MILQALHDLAEREKLIENPDYEMKPVRWIVTIGPGGKFLGLSDTNKVAPQEGKKKPKLIAKTFALPRETARTSGDKAFFFCDKADYVFGVNVDKDEKKQWPAEKLANRFALFREKVSDCAKTTNDEAVIAVRDFLEGIAAGKPVPMLAEDVGPGDAFAFKYTKDDALVSSRETVRRYWNAQRNQTTGLAKSAHLRCLVSGVAFAESGLFPPTKKAPGIAGDTSLISFNAKAFESYGWEGNENAPVSREAGVAASTGLNRLLNPAYPDPSNPELSLPRRTMRLTDDTALCYWSAKPKDEFSNAFDDIMSANPESVREEYRSIWRGVEPPEKDLTPFYGLIITGQKGRAVMRDWFETTLSGAQQNIARHFSDLRIVRNAPWKKGEEAPPAISRNTLLESIAAQGKLENVPATLAAQFMRAAITGTIYPFAILTAAVERSRAEAGRAEWVDHQHRDGRAALIKAVLNRRNRLQQSTNFKEIKEAMDPSNKNPGYVLGCLLAVLEKLQQEALGDVNASVTDKFFSGASAAPRATFDRLMRNARHHARKAGDGENKGLVFNLERLIDAFMIAINVEERKGQPIGFPLTLPIEQQGLFVIGYHHMRHWLFMNRDERDVWNASHPEAPRAFLWQSKKAVAA
ncbi:type I-C CRISPR-associated protein Cas8c/Csd1 [soil metagenome]